jgi:hypothetical protein
VRRTRQSTSAAKGTEGTGLRAAGRVACACHPRRLLLPALPEPFRSPAHQHPLHRRPSVPVGCHPLWQCILTRQPARRRPSEEEGKPSQHRRGTGHVDYGEIDWGEWEERERETERARTQSAHPGSGEDEQQRGSGKKRHGMTRGLSISHDEAAMRAILRRPGAGVEQSATDRVAHPEPQDFSETYLRYTSVSKKSYLYGKRGLLRLASGTPVH